MSPLNGPPAMSFCRVRVDRPIHSIFIWQRNGMSKASQFDVTRMAAINNYNSNGEIFR